MADKSVADRIGQNDPAVGSGVGDKYQLIGTATVGEMKVEEPKPKSHNEGLKVIVVSFVVFAVGVTVALIITIFCAPPMVPPHGAVTSADQRCSDAGVAVLKKGGSAADAAVATALCLTVVQPYCAGLAGGGFVIHHDPKLDLTYALDAMESAPYDLNVDDLQKAATSGDGVTVGVPALLKGLYQLHQDKGVLSWDLLFTDAIQLAGTGFIVSASLALAINQSVNCGQNTSLSQVYCQSKTQFYKEGDMLKNPSYGQFLEEVSKQGLSAMYEGTVAGELISIVQSSGGAMTTGDLTNYTVRHSTPVSTVFAKNQWWSVPEPAAGPVLILLLAALEQYQDWTSVATSGLVEHRIVELVGLSEAYYQQHGDQYTVNITSDIQSTARQLLSQVQDHMTLGTSVPTLLDTCSSCLTVMAPNENYLSLCMSLGSVFGSLLQTSSGLVLNNDLRQFDTDLNHPNSAGRGKRPQSRMAPLVGRDTMSPCGLRLAAGSSSNRLTDLLQVLANLLIRALNEESAVAVPRVDLTNNTRQLVYEGRLAQQIQHDLIERGHDLAVMTHTDTVNIVAKDNETVLATGDIRGIAPAYF